MNWTVWRSTIAETLEWLVLWRIVQRSNEIAYSLHNAGFLSSDIAKSLITDDGYFNFCVPLNMLLGFCENYKRVIINARHELILIWARNSNMVGDPVIKPTLELFKVQWRMPHITLNKLSMLRALESGRYLSMSFHSWELYKYPLLPNTTKHSWAIKIATHLKKNHVIFGLDWQKNITIARKTYFDTCKLINMKFI